MIEASDILKDGAVLTATTIDFNSPEIQARIKEVQAEIEQVHRNSIIDYDQLHLRITI